MRGRRAAIAAVVLGLVLLSLHPAQAPARARSKVTWRTALADSLATAYPPAQIGSLLTFDSDVYQVGTVVVVQQDGISGAPWDAGMCDIMVAGDSIAPRSTNGFLDMNGPRSRSLRIGSRHYVRRVTVKDTEIRFSLATFDTYRVPEVAEGKPRRYRAEVHFAFEPGRLDTLPWARVRPTIARVLAREQDLPAVKAVARGDSTAQVEATLGPPRTVLAEGANVVYVYPRFKVILVDGRVADVE